MPEQSSGSYTHKRLLSTSPQIETWLAIDKLTERECILKRAAPEADFLLINEILAESFHCQARIRSSVVVTARRKTLDNQRVTIEYQKLDAKRWQVLLPNEFWSRFPQSLVQVCAIVDFFHSCGIVHGDLKLENFLFLDAPGELRLVLVDLDFACQDNSKPNALLFGTPGHIAPEVAANECVVTQSDNYSLGVSLRRYLKAPSEAPCLDGSSWEVTRCRLRDFVDTLCRDDCYSRPASLLDSLHEHELLSQDELVAAHRKLLSRILLNNWRLARFHGDIDSEKVKKLVVARSRLLGVGDEPARLVASAVRGNRRRVLGELGKALKVCDVFRRADYWHVKLDDDALLSLYQNLDLLSTGNPKDTAGGTSDQTEPDGRTLAEVERLMSSRREEQAYLLCRRALNRIETLKTKSPADSTALLRHACGLSRRLNRLTENRDYLSRLLPVTEQDGPYHGQVLEDLVTVNHLLMKYDDVLLLIEQRLGEADRKPMSEYDLNLFRIKGWCYVFFSGYSEEGEKILREVLDQASSLGYSRVLMLAYYSLGVIDWRKGNHTGALSRLAESLNIARKANILDKAVAVLSMLTTLHSHLADYTSAVRTGKAAARILSQVDHSEQLPSICVGISYAYTRLADFHKARYWVERYLECGKFAQDYSFTAGYYMIEGYLLLNQSELQAAKLSLYKGLDSIDSNTSAKSLGQFHRDLADIALQQGDAGEIQRHVDASGEAYRSIGDLVSALEIRMLSFLYELLYKGTCEFQYARELLDNEFSDNCRYWSARLLCHLLIASDRQNRPALVSVARKLKIDLLSSPVPVFRVLSNLIGGVESETLDPLGWIKALKSAAQEAARGRARFMLMITLKAIGEAYLERDQFRHAEKYFAQALVTAEALGNKPMAAFIKDSRSSASVRAADLTPFIDSFHTVSEILKEVNQSEESYQRLLQFALDQTGAERAVLLLQAGSSGKLYVAASLNCDSESVKDVEAISRNVTDRVTAGLVPIIVDDALTDKRTRSFGSIVAHNILSVACLPLVREGQLQGVLYLDHNTLPSLFSSRDLKFISAISNFISTVVATAQSYRGLRASNVQLRQDLSRLGQTGAFITVDPVMVRLFEGLPAIARSDVPVLVQGESGTGKEIISEMLHRQSERSKYPLIKLNCAAMASSMVEAELFGIAKYAATGVAERDGKLSAANGGTLLLDEIADMPMDVQAKLLRAIEYQEFEKVGSNRTIHTDIRFICVTNKNIADMVKHDRFRQDLYYRVNRVVIEIPPLRERLGDMELLTEHFLQLLCVGKPRPRFDAEVMHALNSYDWPGNVRELRNFIERCCILYPGKLVDITAPEAAMLCSSTAVTLENCSPEKERLLLEWALRATNGNQTRAARLLKISLSALRRRMKKYGLS